MFKCWKGSYTRDAVLVGVIALCIISEACWLWRFVDPLGRLVVKGQCFLVFCDLFAEFFGQILVEHQIIK